MNSGYVAHWARAEAKKHDLKALTENELAQHLLKTAPPGSAVDIELCAAWARAIMESAPHRKKLVEAMDKHGWPTGGVLNPVA